MTQISRPEASPRVDTCGLRMNSRHVNSIFERKLSWDIAVPSSQYCVRDGFVVWQNRRAARTQVASSPRYKVHISFRSPYIYRCSHLRRLCKRAELRQCESCRRNQQPEHPCKWYYNHTWIVYVWRYIFSPKKRKEPRKTRVAVKQSVLKIYFNAWKHYE